MFNEKKRKSCRNTLVSDVNLTIQIRLTDFLIDVSTAWNFVRLYLSIFIANVNHSV